MAKKKEGIVIGIDLGTTTCLIAILNALGVPEILKNLDGVSYTPSVVNLHDEKFPVIGQAAVNMLAAVPNYIIRLIKRLMGKIDAQSASLPGFIHPDSGRVYLPEEIAAMILRHLKESAEAATGKTVTGAVITVPAYFDNYARQATKKAGELAGLNVLRIVNEPTAAAIAYGIDKKASGTILVYDFGGGTLDVTILKAKENNFQVLATEGDTNHAGSDIDNMMAAQVLEQFKAQTGIDITLESDPSAWYDAIEKCERAKRDLSRAPSTSFVISAQGQRMVFDITREQFNGLIADMIERTRMITERTVQAAKLTWSQIDDVVLVGGSSRIPLVQEMLKKLSGKKPRTDINPDEAVALGAAIVAAQAAADVNLNVVDASGAKVLPPSVVFTDITAHGLGCLALSTDRVMRHCVIIKPNTQVPAEAEDCFGLEHPTQTEAKVTIVQGKPDALPADCTIIGELILDGLPPDIDLGPGANGKRIHVRYSYNAEGILAVTATDTVSGRSTNGHLEHKAGMTSAA